MIGLDTNVVVRYLTQDDQAQAEKVNTLFEKRLTLASPGFVSLITLVEVVWVLEVCYEQSKADIEAIVHDLLTTKQLIVEGSDLVYLALNRFSAGRGDFGDALITVVCEKNGCDEIVSFDKKAVSVGMNLL